MNLPRLLAALALVFGTAATAHPDDKKDKDKKDKPDYAKLVVGKWEVTNTSRGKGLNGSVVEYRKDGTVKYVVKINGKEREAEFASYKVDGDKLVVTYVEFTPKGPKNPKVETRTATIKKLTESELIFEEEKNESVELKRLK